MKENAAVEFVISNVDMDYLKNLPQVKDYGSASLFPVYGGKMNLKSIARAAAAIFKS
ncbi:MAG: oxidoreductase, aldo/keto reductase [Chloroflexi bacterium]|nr:oxidoreductase, aldo/keto reductase [Chloroflexota bacterium]